MHDIIPLKTRYIAYRVLTNLWFFSVVWLYFYRIYITDAEIGMLDALAFSIGLLFEIPSWAIADRIGRVRMIQLWQVLIGSGILIQVFGTEFATFVIGQAILMIGWACASGTDDALFYSSLKIDPDSNEWKKLVTRGSQWSMAAGLLATVLWGWIHTWNPAIPWYLTAIAFFLSILTVSGLKDPIKPVNNTVFLHELREIYHSIGISFRDFFMPQLRFYVPIILILWGLYYTFGFGLLRIILLDRFHFSPFLGSVAAASMTLLGIAFLEVFHRKIEHIRESPLITSLVLLSIFALLLSIFDLGYWWYIPLILLYTWDKILQPTLSDSLNKKIKEEHRATMLSVASFLRTLPYVWLAPLIGYLNTHQSLEVFFALWSILLIMALSLSLYLRK